MAFYQLVIRFTLSLNKNGRVLPQFKRTTRSMLQTILLVILWQIWLPGLEAIATYFGLLSAGIAVALREPISNLFGWAYIIWQRPFAVSNRIQIGNFAGEVLEQGIFDFSLMEIGNWVAADQFTGRIVQIPNSKIFIEPLANFDKDLNQIWNEITVLLTFESNWEKAKKLLQEIANHQAGDAAETIWADIQNRLNHYPIEMPDLNPRIITNAKGSGVQLTIRYLCPPRQRRASEEKFWEAILKLVESNSDITIAYPTQRITLDSPSP